MTQPTQMKEWKVVRRRESPHDFDTERIRMVGQPSHDSGTAGSPGAVRCEGIRRNGDLCPNEATRIVVFIDTGFRYRKKLCFRHSGALQRNHEIEIETRHRITKGR